MNKLKFYRDGNRYWSLIYTIDKQFSLSREEWDNEHKGWWHVYQYEGMKSPGITTYHTVGSPYFNHYVDAMAWICEHYYPGWKLQKKLVKLN